MNQMGQKDGPLVMSRVRPLKSTFRYMKLFPTRTQWNRWSWPTKFTVFVSYLSIVAFVLLIVFYFFPPDWGGEADELKKSSIKNNEIYEHLPVFEFIVERECQDPDGKYCDEVVFIKNIGSGQAINLRIFKFPLPDNKQARAVSYQKIRINKNIPKEIPMLGIGDKKFVYREREYSGKNVKISVSCKDIKNIIFEFTYEGEPRKLRLTHKEYLIRETGEKGSF